MKRALEWLPQLWKGAEWLSLSLVISSLPYDATSQKGDLESKCVSTLHDM